MTKNNYIIGVDEVGRAASKKRASPRNYIIGIDEVGRGPLAGRVFVGAVLLSISQNNSLKKSMRPHTPSKSRYILRPRRTSLGMVNSKFHIPCRLADSNKLSEKQRNEWFLWVRKNKIPFAVSAVSPKIIDKINIARACDKAANSAVCKLVKKYKINHIRIISDAGISVKPDAKITSFKSFPKADEIVPAVSIASIIAKVKRDAEMKRMKFKYPQYGFDRHKGYGTKDHIKAIKKYGPSPIHRRSFIKRFI